MQAFAVAWEGIAVIVAFVSPVKDLTTQQLKAIFSTPTTRWSDVGGPNIPIRLIDRPSYQPSRQRVEEALGMSRHRSTAANVVQSDQEAISLVAGDVSAVTYVSLSAALDAVKYGVGVSVLTLEGIEAAAQTVKDGRYLLRRPVLLLRREERTPTTDQFIAFARSPAGQAVIEELFVAYTLLESR